MLCGEFDMVENLKDREGGKIGIRFVSVCTCVCVNVVNENSANTCVRARV